MVISFSMLNFFQKILSLLAVAALLFLIFEAAGLINTLVAVPAVPAARNFQVPNPSAKQGNPPAGDAVLQTRNIFLEKFVIREAPKAANPSPVQGVDLIAQLILNIAGYFVQVWKPG